MTQSDGRPVRTCLAGFGKGGAKYIAPMLLRSHRYEVSAVVTSDEARANLAFSLFPEVRVVGSLDALLVSRMFADCELVVVSVPPFAQFEVAAACLRSGKDIVVDKPFGSSVSEALDLCARATAAGRAAVPYFNRRFDGTFLTLRRILEEGTLGPVDKLAISYCRPLGASSLTGWRSSGRTGCSIAADVGSHFVDQALVLFGPARVVSSYTCAPANRPVSGLRLRHASGVVTTITLDLAATAVASRFVLRGRDGWLASPLEDVQDKWIRGEITQPADTILDGDYWTGSRCGQPLVVRNLTSRTESFWTSIAGMVARGEEPPVAATAAVDVHRITSVA